MLQGLSRDIQTASEDRSHTIPLHEQLTTGVHSEEAVP